jgi:hypothetical protein
MCCQNGIDEEIKNRLCLGNPCYHAVRNNLFSLLLSKNVKIKTYKIINASGVLYGCETLFPTSREEHRLNIFESMALMRIFGPKADDVTGGWRKLHNEKFVIYTVHKILLKLLNGGRWGNEKCI